MYEEPAKPPPSNSLGEVGRLIAGQVLALVGAVSIIALATAIAIQTRVVTEDELYVLNVLGFGSGLVSLAAAWLALGPLSLRVRLVGAPLATLAALVIVALTLASTAHGEVGMAAIVAGIAQFGLLQGSYWLLRWWLGIRVVHEHEVRAAGWERFQFRLWEMLLVMTLVAVVLGVGRGLVAVLRVTGGGGGNGREMIVIFTLLVGYNLLLAWPLIWSLLAPTGALWKVAVAITLGLLVTATELPAAESFLGPGPDEFFWLINLPQMACLLAHLTATRICGYRLVRVSGIDPIAPASGKPC